MANEFSRPALNSHGERRMARIEEIFKDALSELADVPLVSAELKGTGARESALVITKLQEAKLWAERALLVNPDNLQ